VLTVLRLEIAMLLRERRLLAALGVGAFVLLMSGVVSLASAERARVARRDVAAAERQRWLSQGVKDPHSAAHYSIYAFKPVVPLGVLDPGIDPFVGEAVWLEAHLQNDLLNRPLQGSNAFERIGLADPAGLFIRFAPLVVFLLAFAAVARDREQGTLALALSVAASGRSIAAIKMASVTATASITLVGALSAVAVAGTVLGGAAGDAWLRLAIWVLAAIAYVAVLSIIGVLAGLLAPTARAGFGALLLFWLIAVLGALPAASAAAGRARPLPSFQEMKIRLDRDAPAYWTPEVGAERQALLMERYGAASEAELDALQVNLRGLELDYAERRAQAVFDREIGGFYRRVLDQDRLYAALAWLSPAIAFDAASAGVAGTDFRHHLAFVEAAERYRRALVNRMNADLIPNPTRNGVVHTNDASLWTEVPEFTYTLPGWSTGWDAAAAPAFALGGWLVAGVVIAAWTTARLRP
jgi:ABC-2 type transport system permease protein